MPGLERLLRPNSIAAIGGLAASRVVEQCQLMGFKGDIWPVHPTKKEVGGLPAFASVEDLPGGPDAAFIGVNRHLTIDIVRSLQAIDAGGAVCYAAGFLESDETGGVTHGTASVDRSQRFYYADSPVPVDTDKCGIRATG